MGRKKKTEQVDLFERRHANIVPVIIIDVDKKRKGFMCSCCKTAWVEKDLYKDECPLCSSIFDGELTSKPINVYTRKYREKKKAEEKVLIKEEEAKEKAKAKAKEEKAKERAKAKEKAKKEKDKKKEVK